MSPRIVHHQHQTHGYRSGTHGLVAAKHQGRTANPRFGKSPLNALSRGFGPGIFSFPRVVFSGSVILLPPILGTRQLGVERCIALRRFHQAPLGFISRGAAFLGQLLEHSGKRFPKQFGHLSFLSCVASRDGSTSIASELAWNAKTFCIWSKK